MERAGEEREVNVQPPMTHPPPLISISIPPAEKLRMCEVIERGERMRVPACTSAWSGEALCGVEEEDGVYVQSVKRREESCAVSVASVRFRVKILPEDEVLCDRTECE